MKSEKLAVYTKTAVSKLNNTAHRIGFKVQKHSPEILVTVGVIGSVVSAVMACKATTKISQIIEPAKETLDTIKEYRDNPSKAVQYTEEDAKKDTLIVYTQTGLKLAKLYAPAVTLGVLSVTSILVSHNMMRKRNLALGAAYTALSDSFKEYRKGVVEKYGEEADKELRFRVKEKEIEENGEKKTVVTTEHEDGMSDYARLFDPANSPSCWRNDPNYNQMFLRAQQSYANDLLVARGYLFLNEVYDLLGFERSRAGQVVGWRYRPNDPKHKGDNYVDFHMYDMSDAGKREFILGNERSVWLDFNVDGYILDDFM